MKALKNKPPPERSERKLNVKAGCTADQSTHPAKHPNKRITAHGMLIIPCEPLFGKNKNRKGDFGHGAAKESFEEDG